MPPTLAAYARTINYPHLSEKIGLGVELVFLFLVLLLHQLLCFTQFQQRMNE